MHDYLTNCNRTLILNGHNLGITYNLVNQLFSNFLMFSFFKSENYEAQKGELTMIALLPPRLLPESFIDWSPCIDTPRVLQPLSMTV